MKIKGWYRCTEGFLKLTTAATEHREKFCLFCFLYFSMALQFFLFSLLVLNMCWRSESDCTFASSWFREYYDIGWATCDSSTQYITWLLWERTSFPENKRAILSQGKCCPMAFYGNMSSTCQIANLRAGLAE